MRGTQNATPTPHLLRPLPSQPTLVNQVYEAILSEISAGKFGLESRLIQEELAESLGVSRQPVQQALLLLRSHGILRDAPGRGLMVAPLDPEFFRNLYEVRGTLDGLASGKAAQRASDTARREGLDFIARGREAVKSGSIAHMIVTDMDFHFFLYGLASNPLIGETSSPHWSYFSSSDGGGAAVRQDAGRDLESARSHPERGDVERPGRGRTARPLPHLACLGHADRSSRRAPGGRAARRPCAAPREGARERATSPTEVLFHSA